MLLPPEDNEQVADSKWSADCSQCSFSNHFLIHGQAKKDKLLDFENLAVAPKEGCFRAWRPYNGEIRLASLQADLKRERRTAIHGSRQP